MAVIKPFQGLLYNRKVIDNIENVVAPPYDVISEKEQQALYRKHKYNIIRLILGKEYTSDTDKHNRYTRTAKLFADMQRGKILLRDKKPSFYYYVQNYSLPGGMQLERKGILTLLKITEFDESVVLRHERILAKPFEDRVNLIKECRANFSPIFMIYSDKKNVVNSLFEPFLKKTSYFSYTDNWGVKHSLQKISDGELALQVEKAFRRKQLIIADGHHRYSASLAYRNYMRKMQKSRLSDAPYDYTMVYLTSMEDEGLSVLPIHRMVHSLESYDKERVLKKMFRYFKIEMVLFNRDDVAEQLDSIKADMARIRKNTVFVLYFRSDNRLYLLRGLKDKIADALARLGVSSELAGLDVIVLHKIVFEKILSISKTAQEKQKNIHYIKGNANFLNELSRDNYQMAFFMNPLSAVDIYNVVKKAEILPQKSTFFYPKLTSGFVINKMDADIVID
ncbi:DUF1015 domain-containing protein [candidate division KSB1 bacterium]